MDRTGRLSVRHPRQWWIDVLLVWSIVTLAEAAIGVPFAMITLLPGFARR